jgi:SP family general alpha glucoside:H+ symporter-like MFS transporter
MATMHDSATMEAGRRSHSIKGDVHFTEQQLVEAAAASSEAETQLPRLELFKRYRPAVIFSGLLSIALVMEGMDVGLINNFFAHPAYRQRFGNAINVKGELVVSTRWQTIIGAGNNVGSIIGLLLNGWLQSRYGSRRVYLVSPLVASRSRIALITRSLGRHGPYGRHYLRPLFLEEC